MDRYRDESEKLGQSVYLATWIPMILSHVCNGHKKLNSAHASALIGLDAGSQAGASRGKWRELTLVGVSCG